jgi:uncharacterized protein YxjI
MEANQLRGLPFFCNLYLIIVYMEFNTYTLSVRGFFKKYFEIYTNEQLLYVAKSTSLFNKNFVLFDTDDNELFRIKQKLGFFNMKYIVIKDGYEIAQVVKSAFDKKLICQGDMDEFFVEGNFFNTEYDIYHNDEEVGKVSRKLLRLKKSYGIAVDAEVDQLSVLCLCVILAIINVMRQKS